MLENALLAHARLRDDIVGHLWKRFPQHAMILTDPGTRRAVDLGIVRAGRQGFRAAAEVRPFVSLMVFLGSHFDEDPQLPWAQDNLLRSARESRPKAMAALLEEVSLRMLPLVGRKGEYYRRALAWSEARSFDTLAATHEASDDGLCTYLKKVHRRKYNALGREAVLKVIELGRRSAEGHGLTTGPAVVVYLGLMFLLGSSFDRDPFHPWAAEVLALPAAEAEGPPGRALHARACAILRRFTRLDRLMNPPPSRG